MLRKRTLLPVLRARQGIAGEQESGVNSFDEACQRAIARGGDQRLVEADVGFMKKLLRRLARRASGTLLHASEGLLDTRDVGLCCSLCGKPGRLDLKDPSAVKVLGQHLNAALGLKNRGENVSIEDVPM